MMRDAGSKVVVFLRSVLLLGALVVGVPWLLIAAAESRFGGATPWYGVPAPSDWSADRIGSALTDRLTDDTVADIVIRLSLAVAWIAVVVFVVTVVVEAVHMARHEGLPMPDVRGFGMSQRGARIIAAGLLVIIPMFSSASRAVAQGDSPLVANERAAATAEHQTPAPGAASIAHPINRWAHQPVVQPQPAEQPIANPAPTEAATASAPGQYTVKAGDSIYAIAERHAGADPQAIAGYADRLLEINLGTQMPDGQRFQNAAYIEPGWLLQLPDAPAAAPTPAPAPEAAASAQVHVVEQGETLWSIADDELGDPTRWPEIYDANHERTFDDGRSLDDPDLIQPGWDLAVPGDPAVAPPSPPVTDADEVAAPSVEVETPAPAQPTNAWHESAPSVPAPESAGRADDLQTHADVPSGVDAPAPIDDGIPAPAAVPAPAVVGDPGSGAPADAVQADPEQGESPQLITFGRAAMLSAGVLTLLAVRRRNQLRRAQPRSHIPEPGPEPAATERALRAIDAGERFARIDIAIRAAAMPLIEHRQRVLAVLCASDGELELIATGPASLPAPWTGRDDRWTLPASTPLELLAGDARRVGAPTPALVQLGRTADERDVYVDLEALAALEIGGPGDQADAIVTAVATTLAGSVLAEVATLVGLGVNDDAFLGHRLHVPVRDSQRALEAATEAVGSTATMTVPTFELRARVTSGETWEPAVVIVGSAAGQINVPRSTPGVAVVSASPIHGPSSRLAPDGDAWVLKPAGIRLIPVGVSEDDLAAIAELVTVREPEPDIGDLTITPNSGGAEVDASSADSADAHGDHTIVTGPDIASTDSAADDAAHPAPPPDWRLLVHLLGPVEVTAEDDSNVEFARSKTRELVAWLATHRERSTRGAARTALWELDVRDATFANVVSEARRSLARLVEPAEGEEWVGRTMTDSLPLHDLVRTDAELLEHALETARLQPPALAIDTLAPAVELIGGVPFAGTSYLWPDAEGITSNLVLLATSAATELAAHCLSVGDIEGVFRATGRGLQVLAGHEELIGLRMRAHARSGDHAGVRQEWESYERVITADPWSDGEPSPKLVDLRRELLNPSR